MRAGGGCGPAPANSATCPSAGISQLSIALGDGDDGVTVATPTNAVVLGGTGDDTLVGAGGQDVVRGEDGADTVRGGAGDDTIDGGPGNDALDPGLGGNADHDTLAGGEGDDSVSYGLRSAPVATTKDGVANDGQAGEGDNIGLDIERITGGVARTTRWVAARTPTCSTAAR